jgi:hypothetical protein
LRQRRRRLLVFLTDSSIVSRQLARTKSCERRIAAPMAVENWASQEMVLALAGRSPISG